MHCLVELLCKSVRGGTRSEGFLLPVHLACFVFCPSVGKLLCRSMRAVPFLKGELAAVNERASWPLKATPQPF